MHIWVIIKTQTTKLNGRQISKLNNQNNIVQSVVTPDGGA